ncbi:Protein of unknown function [Pyronema omphalodes CBS 100304]|uniref:Uncharacterized protein n=1 Tax=Pyronema omphalodes (strain CBS 100304) TaxID=1076935 RepID=U4L876_PYROM|nr:Protein of unknown function [Pyronema omphalodes CBS 100304]
MLQLAHCSGPRLIAFFSQIPDALYSRSLLQVCFSLRGVFSFSPSFSSCLLST